MGNTGPLRIPRKPKTILSTSANGTTNGTVEMAEAIGLKDWAFSLAGQFTNFSVTLYGTLDPAAVLDNGKPNPNYPVPGAAGGAWFALPAPSVESTGDTNTFANPLTTIQQALHYKGPLVAVCAVAVGTTPTGTVNVLAWAVD